MPSSKRLILTFVSLSQRFNVWLAFPDTLEGR